jgi:hypothetical protein
MKRTFGFLAVAVLMACNSSNKSTEVKDSLSSSQTDSIAIPAAVLSFEDTKLQAIYNAYISLKDKLVATNFDESKLAAGELATNLKGYKGCESAEKIAITIAEAKDIVGQRASFTNLNVELIPIFKQASLVSGTMYLQHCPMANNGDGGDWISSEQKIQNPYYGDEMMECGRVVEEIKSK